MERTDGGAAVQDRRERQTLGRRARALAAALGLPAALACGAPEAIVDCEPADGRVPVCGFTNPEDLAPAGRGHVVVSQYPEVPGAAGSLVAWTPATGATRPLFPAESATVAPREGAGDPACPGPPDAARFAPHGIDVAPAHGPSTLWVVNHGGREAVERFRLEGVADDAPRLVWEGCVPLPDEAQANDVVALPGGGLALTWFMPRGSGLRLAASFGRIALGLETGRVLRWSREEGFRPVPGTGSSAPNGIEISPDGRVLFVAAWGDEALLRVPLEGGPPESVPLPHHPDNLTWAPDGALLVTGQEGSVTQVVRCARLEAGTCGLSWSVVAVDPASLSVRPVVGERPAATTGAASVALAMEGSLLIGTFDGDRILQVAQ